MQKQRNKWEYGSTFTVIGEKIFDVLILGILWILCSLPLISIGAASTALYYALVKCVKNNDGYIVKDFFRAFKRDFVQSVILWVLIVGITFLMHLNIGILMSKTEGYAGLFFICLYAMVSLFVLLTACYTFPALSRYDMSTGWILKISMYMAVRYLGTSIAILFVLICFGVLIWKIPMLLFAAPGAAVFIISEFMERVLKRHEP